MRRNIRRNRRSSRAREISVQELRRLVMKEAAELSGELEDIESVSAEEVDADGYADTLENDIDMYKAMQVEQAKLQKQYKRLMKEAARVRRNKQLAKKKILRRLKE